MLGRRPDIEEQEILPPFSFAVQLLGCDAFNSVHGYEHIDHLSLLSVRIVTVAGDKEARTMDTVRGGSSG